MTVPAPSEKALRYYRSGNVIWVVEQLLGLGLPALLLFSGLSARLRTVAASLGRGHFYPTLLITLALLSVLLFVIQCPLSYYVGYVREHAYGLTTQRFASGSGTSSRDWWSAWWWGRWSSGCRICCWRAARRWWLWTGALSLPFFTLVLLLTPAFIAPLFNKFGPMKDKALEGEVLAEAARVGVEGARVFEVDKSVDTEKVNAYVTGVGRTKRIVLWDTLLARLSPRQIRFVVGHELGHYVLGHVVVSIFLSSALMLLGLYGVHRTADLLLVRGSAAASGSPRSRIRRRCRCSCCCSRFSRCDLPGDAGPLALPRAGGRSLRARADPRQPCRGDRLRGPPAAEPGRSAARVALQIFPRQPPAIGERVDFINAYRPWDAGQPERYRDRMQP